MKTNLIDLIAISRASLRSLMASAKAALPPAVRLRFGLAFLAAAAIGSAQAQIQTAGTLFINVDATALSMGALSGNDITNSGSLGGFFESTNASSIAAVSNVNALILGGD
jgi:hypothetical protein